MSHSARKDYQLSTQKVALLQSLLKKEGREIPSSATQAEKNISRRTDDALFPLSFAQQRLWFQDQLNPGSSTYIIPLALHLTGKLHNMALEQSLREILTRHEVLRGCIANVDGSPLQKIMPVPSTFLQYTDLSSLSPAESTIRAKHAMQEEFETPFDLAHGPLLRFHLLRLQEQGHLLLLTMHHIISDGWSIGVMGQELAALYNAFVNQQPSPLPPLPIQYADYAVWQRQRLQGSHLEQHLLYWKHFLAGRPTSLELPLDHPRPPVRTFHGRTSHFHLSAEVSQQVHQLSKRLGATLFMTLLSAFSVLLMRTTAQDDLVIGTMGANRIHPQIENLIGFFVNTLALRIDLSGDPSFQELIHRVQEMALETYSHQEVPFEQIVEAVQEARDASRSPLVQVLFGFENASTTSLQLADLQVETVEASTHTTKVDLSLTMQENEGSLSGILEYNTDLFDVHTMDCLVAHFQVLLQDLVTHPEQSISRAEILTREERQKILYTWNNTARPYPKDICVHQLIQQQVQKTPQRVAVLATDGSLSYEELNRRANQLAHHLQHMGIGPDILVGICLPRSLELVIALLAVLKSGGAYVPLDPGYPQERLNYMLDDADVSVLLTQSELRDHIPTATGRQILCIDQIQSLLANEVFDNPYSPVNAQNLAYVIYTSGSTGRPKGAMNTHEALCCRLQWLQDRYSLCAEERVLQKTPFSFDVSVWEFFWPLMTGACMVLAQPEGHRDPAYLVETICQYQITTLHFVPSMLDAFLQMPTVTRCAHVLKRLFSGGEALSVDLARRCLQTLPEVELHNHYGPAETAIDVAAWRCQLEDYATTIPIGKPIHNVRIYILDAYQQVVPIGTVGELYIGGIGIGRGYWRQETLTARRFIPDPFSQEPEARLYRTGDRARYRSDGNIEYMGRLDRQVKLRGYRIELEEIETILNQHPSVRTSVVQMREVLPGEQQLIAYVIGQDISQLNNILRQFLKERLPEHMVPAYYIALESFPLMANGKVDRAALPLPHTIIVEPQTAYVAPRDTIEMQLVQIWEDLLNRHPIGVTDNFFDLGGHSLLAVRFMARVQAVFGQHLPLSTLFQHSRIEHLATLLRQQQQVLPQTPLVGIQTSGTKRPFFCVHPVGGEVFCYVDLARQLGKEQPFYGLEMIPLAEGQKYVPLAQMAAHYIQAMRSLQPQGPYLLGGWSLGGVIAFEMACQLQEQGQKVALLALLDSYGPSYHQSDRIQDDAAIVSRLVQDLEGLFNIELPITYEEEALQLNQQQQLLLLLDYARKANILPPDSGLPQVQRLFDAFRSNIAAVQHYQARQYQGQLTLFNASETEATDDPAHGWHQFVSQAPKIYTVPGNHYEIVRVPFVETLAKQLTFCIEQALETCNA